MEFLISGVLSLGSVIYFRRLATGKKTSLSFDSFGIPDGLFAALLMLWFGVNVASSWGREIAVTQDALTVTAVFSALLVICILCFLIVRSINPVKIFGLGTSSMRLAIPGAVLGLIAALPVIYFFHALNHHFLNEPTPQPLMQFLLTHPSWNDRLLLAFTAVVVAPVSEELIFRGYIYGVIRHYSGRWWALGISAALFAAIHAHIPSMGGLMVLAVTLTLVYEFTGSLWGAIFMHALFNSINILLALKWPNLLQ